MKGRITRLISHEQSGVISAEDGVDYDFERFSLLGMTFAMLSVGVQVTFVANAITKRAVAVRFSPTGVGGKKG